MSFLLILVVTTAVAAAITRVRSGTSAWRQAARCGLGVAFVVAGASHLVDPTPFEQHLPDHVPAATAVILVSGVVEIGLGAALLVAHAARRTVGILTAAFLVAVLPANVYVAAAGVDVDGLPGGIYPWLRLPLQGVFIAWALWSTGTGPTGVARDEQVEHFGLMPPVPPTAGSGDSTSEARSTVQASVLQLRRFRDVPAFAKAALRLREPFAAAPGAISMSMRAAPLRRTFWTLSQWESTRELRGFVGDPAHQELMRRFGPAMRSADFVTWHSPRTLAPTWAEAGRWIGVAAGRGTGTDERRQAPPTANGSRSRAGDTHP